MYICAITKRCSRPGEPLNKIVVSTRPKTYFKTIQNEETKAFEEVVAGKGWEVCRELGASKSGLEQWESWSGDMRQAFLANNP